MLILCIFAALMNHFDMSSVCIQGEYEGASHYWNAVEINGFWYYVDVESDDNSGTWDCFNTNDLNGRYVQESLMPYIPIVMCDNSLHEDMCQSFQSGFSCAG